MRYGDKTSRQLFKAGTHREGWWTYKDKIKQLKEDAIYVFENLHPGCQGVFLLNNSSNHGAFANNALVASRTTLNRKKWPLTEKYQFKDTSVVLFNGEVLNQSFYEVEKKIHYTKANKPKRVEVRYFKGIRRILEERNKWLCDLEGKEWKLHCGESEPGRLSMCCARHFLQNKCPDFKN
jgi:hypothetical protein